MDKGAHFYRCDFQVHSPRDRNWEGGEAVTAEERREYAAEFIAACRAKELDAVAITDHHDMAFVRYIREAAANELDGDGNPVAPSEQITVFPGMELTLAVPCQALILFDANFPEDLFDLACNALAMTPADATEAKTAEVERLSALTGLDVVYDELNKHAYLKGRYIILPNVSDGGTTTLLRSGHASHYRNMPCVGGYLDGSTAQLGEGNTSILNGRDPQYGQKALGLFQTSDNRRRDFRDLGTHSTWVKWAEPTAEALRQACLARESRISQVEPLTPAIAIESLNVSNSAFMGPVFIELNTQYNAFIGGRGTGKSTLLEYVRWTLCDEPTHGLEDEDLPDYQSKRRKLVRSTLASLGANVEVHFVRHGVPHTVRKDAATGDLTLKIGDSGFEPSTEADIRSLLPIQAYSQKQLSNVGVRLEELQRFINTPIKRDLDDLDARFEHVATEIRRTYAAVQQQRLLQVEIVSDEREEVSISKQVDGIRRELSGLGPEDRTILAQRTAYDREAEIVAEWTEKVANLQASLDGLRHQADALTVPDDLGQLPNAAILTRMGDRLASVAASCSELAAGQAQDLQSLNDQGDSFTVGRQELESEHSRFEEAYEEAKSKSTTHESKLVQLTDLEGRHKMVRNRLTSKRSGLQATGQPEPAFAELRRQWQALHEERHALLHRQCERLTRLSASQIRASLKRGALVEQFAGKLKAAVAGTNIRATKVEGLCNLIAESDDPVQTSQVVVNEMEVLARLPEDDPDVKIEEVATLTRAGLTRSELQRVARRLTAERWLELCVTVLEDEPVFEYRLREDEYISFGSASAGQQATALLFALLNEDGPPLIIDQPEDDLDNQVILDVVERIWDAKQKRQLIFSSHNANVVVNGDAELVICCDYRVAGQQTAGMIKCEGAIDVATVRDQIAMVMEGGVEAFRLRKEKYGF